MIVSTEAKIIMVALVFFAIIVVVAIIFSGPALEPGDPRVPFEQDGTWISIEPPKNSSFERCWARPEGVVCE